MSQPSYPTFVSAARIAGQLLSPRNRLVYTLWSPQRAYLAVGSAHLKPRHVAQPQLDAVEPGFLDQVEAALESPVLRDHVVADGFFHGAIILQMDRAASSPEVSARPKLLHRLSVRILCTTMPHDLPSQPRLSLRPSLAARRWHRCRRPRRPPRCTRRRSTLPPSTV